MIRNAVVLPGFADNYFHFLFDTVGALAVIEPALLEGRDLILFSHGLKPFHRDVFELLGVAQERLRTQRPGRYALWAKNVVFVDYPTPLTVVHPRTVAFLRDALLGTQQEPTPGKRIYLERTGARSFAQRTRPELRKLLSRHGFVVVHPETLTVRQQIDLVRDAEAVAVDAGAGAANLLFAARRAKVFLLAPLVGYTEAFTPLCALGDMDLYVALSDGRVHPKYLFTWSEVQPEADLETLELCLERAFAGSGATASDPALRAASRNVSYERK
jgi:capsular polysaccharide biosynthesis protein